MAFDSDFIASAQAESNQPLFLYRIHLSAAPFSESDDLYLAESETDVSYFKDTSTAQTYTAFAIRHEGIEVNGRLELPQFQLIVGNINRDMQSYIEEHNGLHGLKVTVRTVFREDLADSAAHRQEVFYVDSCSTNNREATFTCVSKLGALNNAIPGRRQMRNSCEWARTYKGLGCWIDDGMGGYTQPSGFLTDSRRIFDYLDISDTLTGSGTATAAANFRAGSLAPWGASADILRIDLKVTGLSNATLASGYVEIATDASNGHRWTDLSGLGLVEDTWKTIDFVFSDGAAQGTGLNVQSIAIIKAWLPFTGAGAVAWRNAFGRGTDFDTCDGTLQACRWHKNIARYGGFPGVQKRRVFVG